VSRCWATGMARWLPPVIEASPHKAAGHPRPRVNKTPPALCRSPACGRVGVIGPDKTLLRIHFVDTASGHRANVFRTHHWNFRICLVIRLDLRIGIVVAHHIRDHKAAVSQVKTQRRRSYSNRPRTILLHRHLFHAGKNVQTRFCSRLVLFIAHIPHKDARMIAVAPHQMLKLLQPLGVRRHHPRLVQKEHAHLIACIQQLRCRRIVSTAIGVAAHCLQGANAKPLRRIG
jgi:hypothetical protein